MPKAPNAETGIYAVNREVLYMIQFSQSACSLLDSFDGTFPNDYVIPRLVLFVGHVHYCCRGNHV